MKKIFSLLLVCFSLRAGSIVKSLDNGLRVVVKENRTTDIVSVRLYVRTGSMFEQEYAGAGISHYMEHLISGGTTSKRTEEDYRKLEKKIGAYVNAYTSLDHTCYYITCPARYWEEALRMISEWVIYPSFSPKEIEREKGVIIKEILLREKRPSSKMYRIFKEELFSVHPLRYPVIGYEELFKKIAREDIIKYYNRFYAPSNMILVVVGNIEKDTVFKRVKELFSGFERKNFVTPSLPSEPKRNTPKRKKVKINIKNPRLMIGFVTVPLGEEDMYPLDIIADYINLPTGIFSETLKSKKNLVTSIYAYQSNFLNTGYFAIVAEVRDVRRLSELENEIFSLLETLPKKINKEVKKRIIKKKIAEKELNIQSIPREAAYIGFSMMNYGVKDYFPSYIQNLKEVREKDLEKAINEYLARKKAVVIHFLPQTYAEKEEKETSAEKIKEEFIKFENGIRVIYGKNPVFPTFTILIGIEGGVKNETEENNGITNVAIKMLSKGTKKYSKKDIERIFEQTGAHFTAWVDDDHAFLLLEGLREDFETLTDLLKEMLLYPSFPESELEKVKKDVIADIEREDESPETISYKLFIKKLFKKHPYSFYPSGSAEVVKKLNRRKVESFYKNHMLSPQKIVVGIYGDIERDKALKKLKEIFEGLTPLPEKPKLNRFDFQPDTVKSYYRFPQVNIYIAYPLKNIPGRDYYPIKIIQQLFTSSTGRLFHALRGKRDLVYYSFGYINMFNETPLFFIGTQTSMDKYSEVLKVINEEIERLKSEGIKKDELENTVREILLRLPMQMDTNRKKAERRVLRELDGFGYDFDDKIEEGLKKVTPEDVKKVAERYFRSPFVFISMPSGG